MAIEARPSPRFWQLVLGSWSQLDWQLDFIRIACATEAEDVISGLIGRFFLMTIRTMGQLIMRAWSGKVTDETAIVTSCHERFY